LSATVVDSRKQQKWRGKSWISFEMVPEHGKHLVLVVRSRRNKGLSSFAVELGWTRGDLGPTEG
jgi:hypothetical protein